MSIQLTVTIILKEKDANICLYWTVHAWSLAKDNQVYFM